MPLCRFPARGGQLEAGKLEGRCDDAADQGPVRQTAGRLPRPCRHHGLQDFAGGEVRAEPDPPWRDGRRGDLEHERRAGLPQPDLGGIDAVPVAALPRREQEQDRRAGTAPAIAGQVAPGLAVVAAFRMRGQCQRPDDRFGLQSGLAQIDQLASLGMVRIRPGVAENPANQAASAGQASRQGSAAKRKSR